MTNNLLHTGLKKLFLLLIFMSVWFGVSKQSAAFTLLFPDARSAAMGTTGVATDPRNAVFFNPALLATAYEDYGWYAMLPSYHEVVSDPDNLDSNLNTFLDATNEFLNNPSPENAGNAEAALLTMDGKLYRERNGIMLLLGVPSTIISGAFYVSKYEVFSAQSNIGTPDFSDPDNIVYDSTIDYRGVDILEMGFSSALPFTSRWLGEYKLGATLKFQLMDGLGYSELVPLSELKLKNQGAVDKSSTFNFDVGFSKEVGVWKFGLAAQNIVNNGVSLGDSKESFNIDPVLRGGVAYRSRKTYFEIDADFTKSQQLGVADKSQFASAGWEYSLLSWLFLRAGFQQDLGGNNLSTFSYGVGVNIFGFQLDAAATSNEKEEGVYAQLTLKM
jgi:hypothetical protein